MGEGWWLERASEREKDRERERERYKGRGTKSWLRDSRSKKKR